MGKSHSRRRCKSSFVVVLITLVLVILTTLHAGYFSELRNITFHEDANDMNESSENITMVPLLRKNTNSIIFIKTHKTASSTLTNLLHTFVVSHNKSCPIFGRQISQTVLNFDYDKHKRFVLNADTWNNKKQLDVWLNHATFHPFLYELIPTSKNQILSILRNPNRRFLSGWFWYRIKRKHSSINQSITNYINQSITNYNHHIYKPYTNAIVIAFNSMCRELIPGFVDNNIDKYNNWKHIKTGDFLLLISDRWKQSLLVLKHAYNLTFEDLYHESEKHSHSNSRYHKTVESDLSTEQQNSLRKLNSCDWKLYNIAAKILDYRLYEIYKGNDTQQNNDIILMDQIHAQLRSKCKKIIKLLKQKRRGILDVNTLKCLSHELDNVEWNKWAKTVKKSPHKGLDYVLSRVKKRLKN